MPATRSQVYSAPFDAVAARYDETFTSSIIGRAQRAAVWKELRKAFHPGDRVLEIGCGTGVDACYLAERGVEVLACDPSSQMIEVAARRARQSGVQALVHTRSLRAEDISTLSAPKSFDGAFSNFGALNCVTDLRSVAEGLAKLIKPGGTALLCWMGSCCLWEMLFYLGQGDISKAFRRFHRDGVNARIAENASLRIQYPSVRTLARSFGADFCLKSVRGIGVAVPPSYLESWARRNHRAMKLCERFDSWFGDWPGLRLSGDHVLVKLERRHTAGTGTS
jgi:ubiquinone/menaquinone biosynthesis C-methylase UbiE